MFRITDSNLFRIRAAAQPTISFANQPQYNVVIVAERMGAPCSCSQLRIILNIITNTVDFELTPAVATVPENAGIGHDVVTVTATSGGSGNIQYAITGGNSGNPFRIQSDRGLIEVASMLDFESQSSYSLTVQASVVGTSVSDTVTVPITVTDVNESPFFITACAIQGSCPYSINENNANTANIGTITANDPDMSTVSNGMIQYSITPTNVPFTITSAGLIRTSSSLDYEMATSHPFRVVVRDGNGASISTAVLVSVVDLNDNPPVISGPATVNVDENTPSGFVLTQYQFTDDDSGNNARSEFSISSTTGGMLPFTIDFTDGSVTVTGSLDFENVEQYSVRVTVRNVANPQGSDSMDTMIMVNNLNDNRPTFIGAPYSGTVQEHVSSDTSVTSVEAMDLDSGTPGEVRYNIVGGNFGNAFIVNEVSGDIRVASDIDREVVSNFALRVRAFDLGSPQMRRTITVAITVSDINDQTPTFNPTSYSALVREDVPESTEVLTVFAFDNDEPGNPNSEIRYSITEGNTNSHFNIDEMSGVITVISGLDFETITSYTLTILAVDQGSPSREGSATAVITVTNVNDVPPTVQGSVNITLSEFFPVRAEVVDYDATDGDTGTIMFSFGLGNEEGTFAINAMTGRITLSQNLDFESTQSYVIIVVVSDGMLSTTSTLTVNILDENDNSPVFSGPTQFEFNEEVDSGFLIGTVLAMDADASSPNNDVTYAFTQQSAINNYITLNSMSGEIRTVGVLDREELTQIFPPSTSSHTVNVVARDGGNPQRQNSVDITITLQDINDNSPEFTDAAYSNSLLENLSPPQTIFELSATDIDLEENAQIRYSFELTDNSGNSNPFEINAETGLLQTTMPLDCELQSSYSFTLTARDMGSPNTQSSSVSGRLMVLDENDNTPIFSMDPYIFNIPESAEQDNSIARVVATDADKGSNGQIEYILIQEDSPADSAESAVNVIPSVFINSDGDIFLETEFNFEQLMQYNVTVIAKDMGVPRLSSMTAVVFNVQNVDEMAPVFPLSCEINILENATLNEVVAECVATDEDNIATSPSDVLISYSIFSGNDDNIFAIDPNSGGISLLRPLDREATPTHSFTIAAEDLSGLKSFLSVTITVIDVNDNIPQFASNSYSFDFTTSHIRSNTQNIATVVASDEDDGQNGAISYSISNAARETTRTTLTITAEDGGSPSNSITVNLVVSFEEPCELQEYNIDSSQGFVTASLLCSATVDPATFNITLDGSSTLNCRVLANNEFSFQWIQNGSFITNQESSNEPSVSYTITDAQYSDQGGYACKVSTGAGSLQSLTSTASILGEICLYGMYGNVSVVASKFD